MSNLLEKNGWNIFKVRARRKYLREMKQTFDDKPILQKHNAELLGQDLAQNI